MFKEFKEFLTKSNALALAVGVIIGAATGNMVKGIVDDLLMPIISLILPSGEWREAQIVLKTTTDAAGKVTVSALRYGELASTAIDFVIIALVIFLLAKALLPKKPMKDCPECLESIPQPAHKCKYCGSVQLV